MGLLIGFFCGSMLVFAIGVCVIYEKQFETFFGYLVAILGVLFLVIATFVAAPQQISVGLPKLSIDAGEYKVAFVYIAGENVNLGIEKTWGSDKNSVERLYLYQLPKSAFDSNSLNHQAKQLVVVQSGSFKKLRLE